jgi:hypothetical protein
VIWRSARARAGCRSSRCDDSRKLALIASGPSMAIGRPKRWTISSSVAASSAWR